MASPLLDWLRLEIDDWTPSIVGVFREHAEHEWPVEAGSPEELRSTLTDTGHLLPLPSEPAALANVIEIELRRYLIERATHVEDAQVFAGSERSYPDLDISGDAFGGGPRAVDIKCARRAGPTSSVIKSRIALYTGNTFFLWPQLKFSGILRPFGDYHEHLSIVVIYDFVEERPERIAQVQAFAHETWRLASTKRASKTREYIGSITNIEKLVAGEGEFEAAEDFYRYWRHSTRNWKKSDEATKLAQAALKKLDE